MRALYEEKAVDDSDDVVHYLHRRWDENGDTLCGLKVWFKIRGHSSVRNDDATGTFLRSDSPRKVTCMECIVQQAPR